MNVIEVDVGKTKLFSIGQQYNNNALVIHFVNLPNRKNKYIYYKIDDIEEEIPLVSDLFIVSRPLMFHSGEVKAQIITRDENNSTIELTNNFTMRIKPSNYSGIGDDESYPDDPNVKNYFVKVDEKLNSFNELANLVQTKLDNGEFVGAQGPKGEKGDPGDVTEEYRNLANQIAQNATSAQTSATNAQVSATDAQKALDDAKEFVNQTKSEMNQIKTDTELLKNEANTSATNAQVSATDAQKAFDDAKEFVNQAKSELNQIKTDTSALKEEANTSAVNAKSSETKAKEYADKLQASTDDISQLKEDLVYQKKVINELNDKKITKFYASNQGEIHITDSDNGKIQDMMIYGKSSQDGTPSPENPVEIKSVVNPTFKVTNEDGLKVQSVMFDNITLNAIPVSSDGNVTINRQQYIADYVDVERGKVIRKVNKLILTGNEAWELGFENWETYPYAFKLENIRHVLKGNAMNAKYEWNQKNANINLNSLNVPYDGCIAVSDSRFSTVEEFTNELKKQNSNGTPLIVYYITDTPQEENLSLEKIELLKSLATNYPVTNISVNSEQLDGYTVFNYPISMANGWNYIKQQLNDNRDYIYDMDLQSAEAYVNSEYAVTLTELGV